ncbi:MAG: hypothetical protein IJN32_08495 [Thermoguttaceae bacterium]|nr:hypothetical protein [Thermoguttaceae bacterium]
MALWGLLGAVVVGVATWTPINVTQFWVEPNEPAVFRFESESDALSGAFVVKTTDGATFCEGTGTRDGKTLTVEATLPQGFWEIEFPETGQSFGVASIPAFWRDPTKPENGEVGQTAGSGKVGEVGENAQNGKPAPVAGSGKDGERIRDPFFGIDAATTWLVGSDAARDDLLFNARRMGIATYRERTSWGRIESTPGQIDFNADRRADFVRQTAKKYDVPVLELIHDAPGWAGRVGQKYPSDLTKTADSWARIAERWAPTWNSIEVWNEPDIHFGGNLPADQYVPILKAVAQEYGRRGVETPVVGGVIAAFRDAWMDSAAENGMLDACDVFSFHSYSRAPEMVGVCLRYQRWLDKFGASGKPTWITECGRPWKRGTDRPNREADLESAIDVAQKGVVCKAFGFEAYFPFVYPFYEENDNNFGMSDRSNAPLRSIVGYAQSIRLLAGKDCVGEWALDGENAEVGRNGEGLAAVQRSFVFADPTTGERVAVLYSPTRVPGRTVKTFLTPTFVERITGETVAANADGAFDFADGFLFVGVPADAKIALKPASEIDKARERRFEARKLDGGGRPRRDVATVVRYEFDEKIVSPDNAGYKILDSNAKTFSGALTVFNFENEARTLPVRVELLADGKPLPSTFVDAPKTVEIPARGRAIVPFVLNAEKISPFVPLTVETRIGDDGFLSFDLTRAVSRENFVKFAEVATPLDLGELSRWTPSAGAAGKTTFKAPDALSPGFRWGFDVEFGEGDRWVYPHFALPLEPNSTRLIAEPTALGGKNSETAQNGGDGGNRALAKGGEKGGNGESDEGGVAENSETAQIASTAGLDLREYSGVAFRVKASNEDPNAQIRFFAYDEKGSPFYYTGVGIVPADGREHFVAIPFASLTAYGGTPDPFDPARIRAISVGANTKAAKMTLEVGEFYFFK